jgi:ATP-binding cassette subfamily F protein 3
MITLRNVTLLRGSKRVLDGASVVLQPGEKVGLIGRNGAGKSSLFAMLTDRLHADAGDLDFPSSWREPGGLAEVAQDMPETDDPATDFVLQGDGRLMQARATLAKAEESGTGEEIAEGHMLLAEAGEFDAPARAQALLLGLGFKVEQLDAPVNSFSGGWRMRLQLARALMCPSQLLLLDEPTNHLDLDALVWLEDWLKRYPGMMIVISHDREFLDAITKVTLHLEDGKLTRYTGGYTAFEEMRAERMTQQAQAYGKQQERIAHLQRFIDRFKAKASKAKQAQSRVKALARMEKLAPVLTASDFSFEFREPLSLPNPMLAITDLDCGYDTDDGPRAIVHKVQRSVLPGQRIGILGANGQGKSTVVKTLAGDLKPLSGQIVQGKGLAIGYFAQQELDVLHPDDHPLGHMIRLARTVGPQGREQELRDFLGQFRFAGEMALQPVGQMSGGEKARLVLALLVWQRPNLLLLDEPTNHLDLTTREALSIALNEFEGSLMLVSHDRALLREVCDGFWLVANGEVRDFDGDLDDYQRWLQEQSRLAVQALKAAKAGNAPAAAPAPKAAAPAPAPAPIASREDRKAQSQARQKLGEQLRPLKRQLEKVEQQMAEATTRRDALLAGMGEPGLSPEARAQAGRELKRVEEDLAAHEASWLELSESIEQIGKSAG